MASQADYLKRYLSGGDASDPSKSKKVRKTKKPQQNVARVMNLAIHDDEVSWQEIDARKRPEKDDDEEDDFLQIEAVGLSEQDIKRAKDRIKKKGDIPSSITSSQPSIHRDDEDLSPPRRSRPPRYDSPDASPPRRSHSTRHDSPDASPPRRSQSTRHDSPDASPPRRSQSTRHDSPDASPPRRSQSTRHHSPDASPPRRSQSTRHDSPDASPPRKSRVRHDSPEKLSPPSKSSTKPGPRAGGLSKGDEFRKEMEEKKRILQEKMARADPEMMGKDAETVYRDKKGRRLEMLEQMMKQEKGDYSKTSGQLKWGKEAVQEKEKEAMRQRIKEEKFKPLAVYADDEEWNDHQKDRLRWDDPMREFVQEAKERENKAGNQPAKPKYKGAFPPNRFNIRPGYRWDGIDRSNGYEGDFFKKSSERKALAEMSYKWRSEDL
eukprot:TRINITY_DN2572_c0_g1_i3.p1 TRINITY_DN2572_c0_g1~~TRINITY_DN2572_c0_g1_i3.p1  ORF type:complete len:435 (+),score=113.73 TRINITY_DN2572_c0_g1_i3:45-1349(+)